MECRRASTRKGLDPACFPFWLLVCRSGPVRDEAYCGERTASDADVSGDSGGLSGLGRGRGCVALDEKHLTCEGILVGCTALDAFGSSVGSTEEL